MSLPVHEEIEAFWIAHYELFPLRPLSALVPDLKGRRGALLRVEFKNLGSGFADCHPWEELGDMSLDQQLQRLKRGVMTPLSSRSLDFAYLDAKARSQKINLVQSEKIPQSHYLITQLETLKSEAWSQLLVEIGNQGYRRLKIKVSKPLEVQLERLGLLLETLVDFEDFKLRLDFNAKADFRVLLDWLTNLPTSKLNRIEFLEDPLSFDIKQWKALSSYVPLAEDFEESFTEDCVQYKVFKPAVEDSFTLDQKIPYRKKVIVTSYMDHPFGQLCAAYSAAELKMRFSGKIDICGLLTHNLYQKNSFSEQLSIRNAQLQSVEGTGFGFDSLLLGQSWQRLK